MTLSTEVRLDGDDLLEVFAGECAGTELTYCLHLFDAVAAASPAPISGILRAYRDAVAAKHETAAAEGVARDLAAPGFPVETQEYVTFVLSCATPYPYWASMSAGDLLADDTVIVDALATAYWHLAGDAHRTAVDVVLGGTPARQVHALRPVLRRFRSQRSRVRILRTVQAWCNRRAGTSQLDCALPDLAAHLARETLSPWQEQVAFQLIADGEHDRYDDILTVARLV
jgi:hypothetical protein